MAKPKRVLCIMDMASVGRSSLAVVLPVLSACGVQCCPLPSALYSTHTGGFKNVQTLQTAEFGVRALQQWASENIHFDAVYTGYLCGEEQFALAKAAFLQYPNALKVADPAMADGQKLYTGLPPNTPQLMQKLCTYADLIMPNLTESALLAGVPLSEVFENEANSPQQSCGSGAETFLPDQGGRILNPLRGNKTKVYLKKLSQSGRSVLITSAINDENEAVVLGFDAKINKNFCLPVKLLPHSYPGTGDIFSAVVVGLLLCGQTLKEAAQNAVEFVGLAVETTANAKADPKQGVWFEFCLPKLMEMAKRK